MRNLVLVVAPLLFAACQTTAGQGGRLDMMQVTPGEVSNVNTADTASPKFQLGSYNGGNGVLFFALDSLGKRRLFFYNGGDHADALPIEPPDNGCKHDPYVPIEFAGDDPKRADVQPLGELNVWSFLFWDENYRFFAHDGELFVAYDDVVHHIDLPMKITSAVDFTAFDPTGYEDGPLSSPDEEEKEGLIVFAVRYTTGGTEKETPWIIKLRQLRACLAQRP